MEWLGNREGPCGPLGRLGRNCRDLYNRGVDHTGCPIENGLRRNKKGRGETKPDHGSQTVH